ncbi:MAG TPA: pilus assembly protein PilM, partial [Armatimonadota bacterium]|nr:pilus assembly protein PilM [Armatimonadota bacterium]
MPIKKAGGPVVGLDIGTNFIKACEIDCRGGKPHLRGIAVLPTPPEAVANNEITDPVTLGKTIKQVLSQAGIKARQVVTAVAGQSSLVVRIIEVPKMTRAELQETMKWEIERHVPFAAEQVVMDYQPLVSPEEVPDGQ